MSVPIRAARRSAVALVLGLLVSACALPRPGPSPEEIVAGSRAQGGALNVVIVTDNMPGLANQGASRGFSRGFLNARQSVTDLINPGDVLSVTVWENVENGLLVPVGQKVAVLERIQVDQSGNIFMPYAGVLKAAGKTPEQLRLLITRNLGTLTPDPQVEVRREPGDGASVSLIGGVAGQGVYPILPSTATLAPMLASGGGVTIDPETAIVTVRRAGHSGSIYLQDLYNTPRFDIALRAGDTIIVEEDRRAFTALGATGAQARVPFPRADINVIEALAEVGGLDGNRSDPTGIFIFRRESAEVANKILGRRDMPDGAPFAYVIDLTRPSGIFVAKSFMIRDDDTIYVTEAPFVAWSRILEATASSLNFATTLSRTLEAANDS